MVSSKRFEPPDLVVVMITGVVTPLDQAELVGVVRAAIQSAGSARVLLHLQRFGGWNPEARLDAESLWLRDDEGVSKIAIVGDPEWKIPVLTLVAQPIRQVPIQYFENEAAARHWLERPAYVRTPNAST